MPPRRYKEESKELKKAKAKYEKHFDVPNSINYGRDSY